MNPRADELKVHIHARGDRQLDGILRLVDEAGRARPLAEVLARLCADIAEIACSEVVSVYVIEADAGGGESLVLRGNVGFPESAVGTVRLRVGEGLTGFVAECLRPVSLAVAPSDERYKHVPGIGEERFPSYLGVPLLGGGVVNGVLVLQRRASEQFTPADVALATALAAPVCFALERAQTRAGATQGWGASSTTRPTKLEGRGHGGERVVGRVDVIPTLEALLAAGVPRGPTLPGRAVAMAHAALARELGRACAGVEGRADLGFRPELRALGVLLEDTRVRDAMIAAADQLGVGPGLARAAASSYHVPGSVRRGGWLVERPAELADLCLVIAARTIGAPLPAPGSVVVCDRLTGVLAVAAVARRASAIVVSGGADASALGLAVARAASIPAVTDVVGLFAWARGEDRILVDGETGAVLINPPA
jgi:phosphotransferase system, enzyme I, PtsP